MTDRMLTMSEALREAMSIAMEERPEVFILGEDIGIYGGAFGVTGDLYHRFGSERVRDTPISELGIVGAAVGAALSGMRPIVEIQFSDFTAQAMDQIVNQAAKIHFMVGGGLHVPLVLRAAGGSGTGAAAQHSQSLEGWFANVPGLKVVIPSSPYEAKGLLLSSIDDPNPVIFLEHKLLYKVPGREPVPEGAYRIPLGVSRVLREGKDLTVVATGIMVSRAMAAAEELDKEGLTLTIIDPRTISPLDMDPVYASLEKTGRLMVVQEAPEHGGFLNEVIARVATGPSLGHLIAPVSRLAGMNIPIPYAPQLEKAAVPQIPDIVRVAREVVANWR
ncbi:MAG: alpha-ketoacid dehydrogenase subunit beta [Candidatus Nanopelagicaceae bacterium]|nr:alpha-ketoacid dehydrogenase subunit beta [Candidatus Nanopelagicaceae bacterium]